MLRLSESIRTTFSAHFNLPISVSLYSQLSSTVPCCTRVKNTSRKLYILTFLQKLSRCERGTLTHFENKVDFTNISPSADFRFKEGDNHSVFVYVSYVGPEADHSAAYPGRKKFSDEGGKAIKGVLLFSRTLLSSIFCYLLLHNFSLFVSFIKFFTVNFIHSDLPFKCLNRLTVYTAFINHFTSLYIVFNLPFGPYLVQRFNCLKC